MGIYNSIYDRINIERNDTDDPHSSTKFRLSVRANNIYPPMAALPNHVKYKQVDPIDYNMPEDTECVLITMKPKNMYFRGAYGYDLRVANMLRCVDKRARWDTKGSE